MPANYSNKAPSKINEHDAIYLNFLFFNSCGFSPLKFSKILLKRRTEGRTVRFYFYTEYSLATNVDVTLMFATYSVSALTHDMEKHCNIEIAAKVVRVSTNQNGTEFSYGIAKFICHW